MSDPTRSTTPKIESAECLIRWAANRHGERLVMSTSFGIQSAALLHLATRRVPNLPVVWVDTGYLPDETYRFAEALTDRLGLNLHVAQAAHTPARMEALHGQLFASDLATDRDRYDQLRKVEPMQRTLDALGATGWLAGLRADQTDHRRTLPVVGEQWGREKILPLLDWTTRDLHAYLKQHDLPYHPLFEQGYATVGDWHSSRPLELGDEHERDTRFGSSKQECGLHV